LVLLDFSWVFNGCIAYRDKESCGVFVRFSLRLHLLMKIVQEHHRQDVC
jgi:hypothetical protein